MTILPLCETVPDWMLYNTQSKVCPDCSRTYEKCDIKSMGLRENDKKECDMYIEHKCPACSHSSVTVFKNDHNVSVEELCYALLEQIKNRKIKTMTMHRENHLLSLPGAKMSTKEFNDLLKTVKKATNHEDFMKKIGAHAMSKQLMTNKVKPKK